MLRVLLVSLFFLSCATLHAQSVAERFLFASVNQERVAAGLVPLAWNPRLAAAAHQHAVEMARRNQISHGFSGEPELTDRASSSGAQFSRVTENVGMSPDSLHMHDAWMRSSGHRANILDSKVTSLGISVVFANGYLWAVEDFARDVEDLDFQQQEARVTSLLTQASSRLSITPTDSARQTCGMATGFAGDPRPGFVMRFSANDLSRLPEQLTTLLQTHRYTRASVGACAGKPTAFAGYNIAVLLYP